MLVSNEMRHNGSALHFNSSEQSESHNLNILLTGRAGVGKTTIIKEVISSLNLDAGGFYTQEIRERGVRKGFEIRTLNGKRGILAHMDCKSPFRVSKYGVNLQDLEGIAVKSIIDALGSKACIIIDEIGRMELFSLKFQHAVKRVLDSPSTVLGCIQARHNPFLDSIRAREDTEIIKVTHQNRDNLFNSLAEDYFLK